MPTLPKDFQLNDKKFHGNPEERMTRNLRNILKKSLVSSLTDIILRTEKKVVKGKKFLNLAVENRFK